MVGFATGAATLLAELLIMLILSFYFMVDGARLAESIITAVPLRVQDDAAFWSPAFITRLPASSEAR